MPLDAPDNIDPEEIARFGAMADRWWDRAGEFKALHDINPIRLAYIKTYGGGLENRRVLDVGCGGGLLAEAMAGEGARVTGIDMAEEVLRVAIAHARREKLDIAYHQSPAEDWARAHGGAYQLVTCMELLEHVPEPQRLVAACADLLQPGGRLFFATVNRTWMARVLVIWVAEYVLGIVRKGTHSYRRFVRPEELSAWGLRAGLVPEGLSGLRYRPFSGKAALCRGTGLNFMMHFKKEQPKQDR